jgi:1,4-dihydroxy-2-naphthoate octaprenyltransferase
MSAPQVIPAPRPSRLKIWMQAVRIFSFTASVIPISAGAALALVDDSFDLLLFVVMLLAGIATHAGCNMANDYYDHKKGVDTPESIGPSRVIQQGLLSPAEVKRGMIVAFAIATLLGLIVVVSAGWPILVVALLSLAAAYFYTAGPKPLGYVALGEVTVYLFMGLAMVMGSYYVLADQVTWPSFLVGSAIGLMAAAILHANNIRDIALDRRAGKATLATIFGRTIANWEYLILVVSVYLCIVGLVALDLIYWPTLIVFATVPVAVRLVRLSFSKAEGSELNPLLRRSAGLHLRFGALLVVGLVLSALI